MCVFCIVYLQFSAMMWSYRFILNFIMNNDISTMLLFSVVIICFTYSAVQYAWEVLLGINAEQLSWVLWLLLSMQSAAICVIDLVILFSSRH